MVTVDGAETSYANIQVLNVSALGGSDQVTVDPSGAGFPSSVNIATSGVADTITVDLAPTTATTINISAVSLSTDTLIIQGASTPDPVLVTDPLIQFDSLQVTFTNVENLTINGAAGNDSITLVGPIVPGTLSVNAGTGDVIVNVGSPAIGSGGTAGGIASQLILNGGPGNDTLNIDDSGDTAFTNVQLTATAVVGLGSVIQYSGFATVNVAFGSSVSSLVIASTDAGITNVYGGAGTAVETIQSTGGQLTLYTGDGNDTVNVQSIGAPATISLGAGNDTVNVGSLDPGTGGVVSGISALLTVSGGSGTDTLVIDDSGDAAPTTGTLTNTTLAGLGMAGSIYYQGIANLTISLGSGANTFAILSNDSQSTTVDGGAGNDTFTIAATAGTQVPASGPLFVDTGNGNDAVNVQSIGAPATISLGAGNDTVTVGSLAPGTGGVVSGISALLTVSGGSGTDTLVIDDSGDAAPTTGTLTNTTLTGLGMAGSIYYQGIASLLVALGSGVNTFTILSNDSQSTTVDGGAGNETFTIAATAGTQASASGPLFVNTGNGNDTVNVQSIGAPATISLGAGNDSVNVGSLAPASGGTLGGITALLTVNGGSGTDTLVIDDSGDATAATGSLTNTTLTGLGMAGGIYYQGIANLLVALGSGGNTFTILSNDSQSTTVDGGAGNDTFTIAATAGMQAPASGPLFVNTGSGVDMVTILSTSGPVTVTTGSGNDAVSVQSIGAAATIILGAGTDTVTVGSLAPATGGVVSGISALLTVNGGTGTDTLVIDDSGDAAPTTGTLTNTTLAGLGMAGSIYYQAIANLTISLGSGGNTFAILSNDSQSTIVDGGAGNDTFTIAATAGTQAPASGPLFVNTGNGVDIVTILSTSGPVTVTTGSGNDLVNVQSIGAQVTISLGAGTDTVMVGSLAPAIGGVVSGISALLTVSGGSGTDTLVIDDSGDTAPQPLVLGNDHIGGLGMAEGIDFSSIASLVLLLGSGATDITIIGTPSGTTTTLTLGPGNDTVNIQATEGALDVITGAGADTINISSDAPADSGTLAGILGAVTIDAARGMATLNVSDSGDTLPSPNVIITATSITGLSPAAITYVTSGGTFNGGVNISAGSGGNTIVIQSTNHDPGTTTTVWSGNGSDTVTVTETDPTSLVINGQAGNDVIDATATTTGVTITDGNGNDVILGGSGNDTITAGNGNDQIIGGLGSNTITAGNGNDIVIGADGEVVRVGGQVVLVESTSGTEGGSNVITVGSGNDVIIGGPGNNTISANGGLATQDIVLGHDGYVTFGGTASFGPGEAGSTMSFNFVDSSEAYVSGVFGAPGAAAGDWNNLDGLSGTYGASPGQSALLSNGGSAPGVTVQWNAAQGNEVTAATVSGLSYYYASYNVYVYLGGDGSAPSSAVSDGSTTYYVTDAQGRSFCGTLIQVTSTNPSAPGVGNYVVFSALTGNSFTISASSTASGAGRHQAAGMAGLQIVGQSQPIDRIATTLPTVGGNDTIILARRLEHCLRRRRQQYDHHRRGGQQHRGGRQRRGHARQGLRSLRADHGSRGGRQ